MQTSLKNSKKCSTLKALLLSASLFSVPAFLASSAYAVPLASVEAPSRSILDALKSDLAKRQHSSFQAVLKNWETLYGTRAVAPLLQIAGDSHREDPDRYLALMGAAKLGGLEVATGLVPFLKDRSWMIRAGALRALGALKHPKTSAFVLPLLRDPALIVRSEAVDTIALLRPAGAVAALLAALEQPDNYHHGKAQWVPGKALTALVQLQAKDSALRLRPLLSHNQDPELQEKTVTALEHLTGKKLKSGAPLLARVEEWKTALSSPK